MIPVNVNLSPTCTRHVALGIVGRFPSFPAGAISSSCGISFNVRTNPPSHVKENAFPVRSPDRKFTRPSLPMTTSFKLKSMALQVNVNPSSPIVSTLPVNEGFTSSK